MIRLIDRATGVLLGRVNAADFRVLREVLQDEDLLDADYYLTNPTLDLLEEKGLSAPVLEGLRESLGDRAGMDLGWEPMESESHLASGRVLGASSGAPLPGLKVEAYDGASSVTHLLGWAFTGPDGQFAIASGGQWPSHIIHRRESAGPVDLSLRIVAIGGEVLSTTAPERMNAESRMCGDLVVPDPPEPEEESLEETALEDEEAAPGEPPDPAFLEEVLELDRPLEHPLGETGASGPHLHQEPRGG